MDDPQPKIVRVLQWKWIDSKGICDARNPFGPTRVEPKTVEAKCRKCDAQWIAKLNDRRPDDPGWFTTSAGRIHLTCPSCKGATADFLLDLDQGLQ
jgi:hypothetical protein